LQFKRPVKSDYTHGNGRMTDIAIENQALAQKVKLHLPFAFGCCFYMLIV
jgi:hypothetical protein